MNALDLYYTLFWWDKKLFFSTTVKPRGFTWKLLYLYGKVTFTILQRVPTWTHFVLLLTLRFYFIIDIWYLMYNDGFIHDFLHSVTYLHGVNVKGNNNDRQNVGALFVEICWSSLLLTLEFSLAVTLFCATQLVVFSRPCCTINEIGFKYNNIQFSRL